MIKLIWHKETKYRNNSIKLTGTMKPFHKKVINPHADSGTKSTNVMTTLSRMQNFHTSKILVIDNFRQ